VVEEELREAGAEIEESREPGEDAASPVCGCEGGVWGGYCCGEECVGGGEGAGVGGGDGEEEGYVEDCAWRWSGRWRR
jgi:hypothetical protein